MQGGYESKYFYNVAVLGGKNMANRQGIITENLSCRTPYGIVNQNSHCGKTVIVSPISLLKTHLEGLRLTPG
jgi:hypothetical protein